MRTLLNGSTGWTTLLLLVVSGCEGTATIGGDGGGGGDDDDDVVDAGEGSDPDGDGDVPTPPGDDRPAFCADYPPADLGAARQSSHVFYGDDGFLEYVSDDEQNRVPDFGYAGYHFGEVDLPDYPEVASIGPGDGDDTARIQAALDDLAA